MKKKNDLIIAASVILMLISMVTLIAGMLLSNCIVIEIGLITMLASFFGVCYGCTVE